MLNVNAQCNNVQIPSEQDSLTDGSLPLSLRVSRGSAFALWSLSKSRRNKVAIKRAGGLPLLARLVKMKQSSILIPVIGTLQAGYEWMKNKFCVNIFSPHQECASERSYCLAMQSEGMIEDLVQNLLSSNPQLKMLCASAIFR